jgi:hypothetical protein
MVGLKRANPTLHTSNPSHSRSSLFLHSSRLLFAFFVFPALFLFLNMLKRPSSFAGSLHEKKCNPSKFFETGDYAIYEGKIVKVLEDCDDNSVPMDGFVEVLIPSLFDERQVYESDGSIPLPGEIQQFDYLTDRQEAQEMVLFRELHPIKEAAAADDWWLKNLAVGHYVAFVPFDHKKLVKARVAQIDGARVHLSFTIQDEDRTIYTGETDVDVGDILPLLNGQAVAYECEGWNAKVGVWEFVHDLFDEFSNNPDDVRLRYFRPRGTHIQCRPAKDKGERAIHWKRGMHVLWPRCILEDPLSSHAAEYHGEMCDPEDASDCPSIQFQNLWQKGTVLAVSGYYGCTAIFVKETHGYWTSDWISLLADTQDASVVMETLNQLSPTHSSRMGALYDGNLRECLLYGWDPRRHCWIVNTQPDEAFPMYYLSSRALPFPALNHPVGLYKKASYADIDTLPTTMRKNDIVAVLCVDDTIMRDVIIRDKIGEFVRCNKLPTLVHRSLILPGNPSQESWKVGNIVEMLTSDRHCWKTIQLAAWSKTGRPQERYIDDYGDWKERDLETCYIRGSSP